MLEAREDPVPFSPCWKPPESQLPQACWYRRGRGKKAHWVVTSPGSCGQTSYLAGVCQHQPHAAAANPVQTPWWVPCQGLWGTLAPHCSPQRVPQLPNAEVRVPGMAQPSENPAAFSEHHASCWGSAANLHHATISHGPGMPSPREDCRLNPWQSFNPQISLQSKVFHTQGPGWSAVIELSVIAPCLPVPCPSTPASHGSELQNSPCF